MGSSGILVGKREINHYRLSSREVQLFHEQNPTVTLIESDCFSFPCLWKPLSSSNSILYQTDETVIITDDDEEETVAHVEGFICAVVGEQFHSFVRGNLHATVKDDDG